jgi:hypothetical protein
MAQAVTHHLYHACAELRHKSGYNRSLTHPFQFTVPYITTWFYTVQPEVLEALLNKLKVNKRYQIYIRGSHVIAVAQLWKHPAWLYMHLSLLGGHNTAANVTTLPATTIAIAMSSKLLSYTPSIRSRSQHAKYQVSCSHGLYEYNAHTKQRAVLPCLFLLQNPLYLDFLLLMSHILTAKFRAIFVQSMLSERSLHAYLSYTMETIRTIYYNNKNFAFCLARTLVTYIFRSES